MVPVNLDDAAIRAPDAAIGDVPESSVTRDRDRDHRIELVLALQRLVHRHRDRRGSPQRVPPALGAGARVALALERNVFGIGREAAEIVDPERRRRAGVAVLVMAVEADVA